MSDLHVVPCPMCGSENAADAASCGVCGYALQPATNAGGHKCARCGSNVPQGFDFCPVCGLDQRHRLARPATGMIRIGAPGEPRAPTPPPESPVAPTLRDRPGGVGAAAPGFGAPELGMPHPTPAFSPEPTPSIPPARTGRTLFVDGPPLARPPMPSPPPVEPPVAAAELSATVPAQGAARAGQGALPVPAFSVPPPAQPAYVAPGFGSRIADAEAGARLVLVGRDGEEGRTFPFVGASITIGRQRGEIVFADDVFLSPEHARVDRSGEVYTLVDLGSSNGVYLRIRGHAPVYPGDLFMVGHELLRLENVIDPVAEQGPGPDGTRIFGTPLKPAWGKLSLIGRGGVAGNSYFLRGAKVSFGREQGEILFPHDPFVSREHARLRLELQGAQMSVVLEDLASANGTYIRIRGSSPIRGTDTFRVGDQILRLRVGD